MIQLRNGFRFTLKSLLANRIGGKLCRQNLDGNRALQPRVSRPVHFSHSACAQRCRDFVGTKLSAWRKGHNWRDYSSKNVPITLLWSVSTWKRTPVAPAC